MIGNKLRTSRITVSRLPVRVLRRLTTPHWRASVSPCTTSKYAICMAEEQRQNLQKLKSQVERISVSRSAYRKVRFTYDARPSLNCTQACKSPDSEKGGGFTLVELVIAMAIFSMMLLIVVSGFLHVVRVQQASLASRNTQHNSRFALEEMVRESRSATDVLVTAGPLGPAPLDTVCLATESGFVRFQVNGADQRLYRQTLPSGGGCGGVVTSQAAITASDVAVVRFDAERMATSLGGGDPDEVALRLSVSVASVGDVSRLEAANELRSCDPSQSGAHYCSVANLDSSVTLRGVR
jgi:prepilin-type N-terminal cleavage/methylation domain-containing protein